MGAIAAIGPSAYWYLTRGTGTVALILLTLSLALGVANVRRVYSPVVPRFVLDAVHRNVSLLAVVFLVLHIVTSLLDGFAPIRVTDAVIPFVSAYRPLWLGFGAVALDLMLAVLITSLLRARFGYRTWRAVHWLSYACWPFAVAHGLGTGSDTKAAWMLVIVAGCVILMLAAVVTRAVVGWPTHQGVRVGAIGVSGILTLALLVWLPVGPLAAGWASRAGTPAYLLAVGTSAGSPVSAQRAKQSSGAKQSRAGASTGAPSFTAQASGSVRQGLIRAGLARVRIALTIPGQTLSRLKITLEGQPADGGGIQMTSSQVTLGTASDPTEYRGRVTGLDGTTIQAELRAPGNNAVTVVAQVQSDPGTGAASADVSVTS
jgi:hypothetical protein